MQFTIAFVTIASALATLVVGAPTNVTDVERAAQVDGHVFLCTDAHFGGVCVNYGVTVGQCSNLPSSLQDNISSFEPDKGLRCCLWQDYNCSGFWSYCLEYPGIQDLGAVGTGVLNDIASSVICERT